jgi:hypothetical protein
VSSWALTTVSVLLLLAVTLTTSTLVPSSKVQKNVSPPERDGKTLPSATDTEVAEDVKLDARVVFALFLKTTATGYSLKVKKLLQSR